MTDPSTASSARYSPLRIWWLALRPKTLGAAVAPVLVGTALAVEASAWHGPSAAVALACALLIQVGTNFSNDYLDYERGTDDEARQGPLRVTQAGLVTPARMRRATVGVFAAAFLLGLYLVYRGGWPVLAIGTASIVAGVLYTWGRYALAYLGLADLFVLTFFGPVAVGGTYYVQALQVTPLVLLAGLGPGLLATAVLLVNNVRDVEGDRRAGKRTLVVRMGRPFGVALYGACLAGAALVPVALYALTGRHPAVLLAALVGPAGAGLVRTLHASRDGARLNQLLARTGQLLMLYAALFTLGWTL